MHIVTALYFARLVYYRIQMFEYALSFAIDWYCKLEKPDQPASENVIDLSWDISLKC